MSNRDNFKYCVHNSNRTSWEIAKPFCTWKLPARIPPHTLWNSVMESEHLCSKCKCFENVNKLSIDDECKRLENILSDHGFKFEYNFSSDKNIIPTIVVYNPQFGIQCERSGFKNNKQLLKILQNYCKNNKIKH